MSLSRRTFLGTSATAVLAAGTMTKGQVFGANEKVRVCVIGINGRGGAHISGFSEYEGSEVVGLCDVDSTTLSRVSRMFEKKYGKQPKTYRDMRDAFADPEIDAVSIATPNHWHTLASIWAMQAGKHVYVEKPATHNVWEGKQLIAAVEKYGKVLQHGTQRRSEANWIRDIGLLQSGEINGPVYMARGLGYKSGNRDDIGFAEPENPPEDLDWRLWQGPATDVPYLKLYHPYRWHWFWHFGNGEVGNQGIHQTDVGAWGMNRGLPVKISSNGGRYTYKDQGETPNTNNITFMYEDGTMFVFEVRNRWTNSEGGAMVNDKFDAGVSVGNLFYTDGGYYVEGQGFYDKAGKLIPVDDAKYPMPESKGCWGNFIEAVKMNDPTAVFGDAKAAHISASHAHLANISYRIGKSFEFDPKTEKAVNCPEADALLKDAYHPDFTVPELA